MAKKLNKLVAIIAITLIVLVISAGVGFLVLKQIRRNPDRALEKAHLALEAGDYIEAESQLKRAYVFGKTDAFKIDRLFELAEYHLIDNDMHEPEWPKAMGFWNKIVTIDADNIQARRNLLDYFYQAADSGQAAFWKNVHENTSELIEVLERQGQEPDVFLLKAHAKALLSIASRGESTDRASLLEEGVQVLEPLIESNPKDAELYNLRAQAAAVQGELDVIQGVANAQKQAEDIIEEWFQAGIEQADDTAEAVANYMQYQLQNNPDPNGLEKIRSDLEAWTAKIKPKARLFYITSIAYENPGKQSVEAEINRAIEAVRQAIAMEPENVEYTLRMARLLYRKGMVFHDPASIQDAIGVAEGALSMDAVQDVPGPLQSRNAAYRITLNIFMADLYLEQALDAKRAGDDEQTRMYSEKASDRVDVIIGMLGTSEGPIAQKYQGLMALAEGQREKGVRLLYDSYQKQRSLDKPEDFSHVDPIVCEELAHIAKQENLPGLEREFLQWAVYNHNRAVLQKPQLILDYADVLARLRAWQMVQSLVGEYHRRYQPTDMSRQLTVRAAIAAGKFDVVEDILAELNPTAASTMVLKLRANNVEIARLVREIAQLEQDDPGAVTEQKKRVDALRDQRIKLLNELLEQYPEEVDARPLGVAAVGLVRQGDTASAAAVMDRYLAEHSDAVGIRVLRLQCDEPDPLNVSPERLKQLREDAIGLISDEKQKALQMVDYYRADGDYDKALEAVRQAQSQMPDDSDLIAVEFDLLLEKEEPDEAEALLPSLRAANADGFEGNLLSGKLEIRRENYQLALRRLDECLTLCPLSSEPYLFKAQIQQKLEQYETAVENIRTAVNMNPRNGAYVRILATFLFERNAKLGNKATPQQQTEAERALASAIQLNPSDWQLQSVYAESIQTQSPDRALAIRQELLEVHPNATNAVMLGNMALRMAREEWDTAKKSGLIQLAGQAFEKGMALEPNNEIIRQAYADYKQMTGKGEEAVKLIHDDENLLWKFYLRNGQFEQAKTLIEKLIAETPDDIILLRGLAISLEGMGERDPLKEVLDKLYEKDDTRENQLWVLQKYMDNALLLGLENKLEGFKERFPEEQVVLLIEAWVKMANGYVEDAMTLANRYLETNTDNPGAWRLRGRSQRLMGEPRKAIEDLQRSKDLQDNVQVRLELANVYIDINRPVSAIGELVSLMDDPGTPMRVRMMLENLYKANNRSNDLDKFYEAMTQKYPDYPLWYFRAGSYYLNQKDFAKAQDLLEKAMELGLKANQSISTVLDVYLETLYQSQQYNKVISVASRYIDGPMAVIAYAHMAEVQAHLGQTQKAVDSFYTALDKAGTNKNILDGILKSMLKNVGEEPVTSWIEQKTSAGSESLSGYLLGSRYAQIQGAYNRAIEYMDKCIEMSGTGTPEYLGYGLDRVNLLIMGYMKTSDSDYVERAIVDLEKMLKLQPENFSLLNNLAYLLIDNDQGLDAALEYARKAHLGDPGNPVYLDTYAYALCKTGQLDEAERNLLRAKQMYEVGSNPAPWDLYKHLALTYESQGKRAEALETYRKALDAAEDVSEKEKQNLKDSIDKLNQS